MLGVGEDMHIISKSPQQPSVVEIPLSTPPSLAKTVRALFKVIGQRTVLASTCRLCRRLDFRYRHGKLEQ